VIRLLLLGMLGIATLACFGLSVAFAGDKRERTGLWMIVLTIPVALFLLWLDVVPGRAGSVLGWVFIVSLIAGPLLLLAGLIAGILLLVNRAYRSWSRPRPSAYGLTWPRMAVWFLILLGTYGMLRLNVPERIAFRMSRSSFEALVEEAPERRWDDTPIQRRVGVYQVDRFARDPRGGVFFRVHSAAVFIDTTSYGFAYRPNSEGTPFGNAAYRTWDLGGGWYGFSASNDY